MHPPLAVAEVLQHLVRHGAGEALHRHGEYWLGGCVWVWMDGWVDRGDGDDENKNQLHVDITPSLLLPFVKRAPRPHTHR